MSCFLLVLSVTQITLGDLVRLGGLLSKDAIEDYRKEHDTFDKVEGPNRKAVTAQVTVQLHAILAEPLPLALPRRADSDGGHGAHSRAQGRHHQGRILARRTILVDF